MGNYLRGDIFPKGSFPRTIENNLVKLFYLFNYDSSKFSFSCRMWHLYLAFIKKQLFILTVTSTLYHPFCSACIFHSIWYVFFNKNVFDVSIMGIYLFNLFKVFIYLIYLYTLFKCTFSTMIPTTKKSFDISLDVAHT